MRHCLGGGVGKVRQQRESEVRIGVGQVVQLQSLQSAAELPARASIDGMTTNVACSTEIPFLTSSLGSTRGGKNKVNTWLTMPTATSENGSSTTDGEHWNPPRECQAPQRKRDHECR